MDLDTFLTTLYVLVDDWCKNDVQAKLKRHAGPALRMSDSEVLTVALAGQWRVGVPWRSERGVVRYMQQHGRGWFPTMLSRSSFNERVRLLWSAFVALQQQVAQWLKQPNDVYECIDSTPLPACSLGHHVRTRRHWLWWSEWGLGGTRGGKFFGEQLVVSVTPSGCVTGWLIGPARADDRWMLEALLSQRAGQARLVGPAPHPLRHPDRLAVPPVGFIGPLWAAGRDWTLPYLADKGFNSSRWQQHWRENYGAEVISPPQNNDRLAWPKSWQRWLSSHRQVVETALACLDRVFDLKALNAHSRWGQVTRVAAKLAAYNLGRYLCRLLARPEGSLETLIC